MMKLIITIALMVSGSVIMAQDISKESMQTFTSKGITIKYPASWKNDTSGFMGSTCFVYAPADDSADKFRENINIVIQELKGMNIDLEQYKEISEKQISTYFPNSTLDESIIKEDGNSKWYSIRYSFDKEGIQVHISSICFIKNEKAYLATFAIEEKNLEKYKKTRETCLASFSLTETKASH